MSLIFIALVMFLAMNALAASMDRHNESYFTAIPVSVWRGAGWLLLAASLFLCLLFWGASIGTLAWFALLTFASLLIGLLFTYRESYAIPAAGCALVALAPSGILLLV